MHTQTDTRVRGCTHKHRQGQQANAGCTQETGQRPGALVELLPGEASAGLGLAGQQQQRVHHPPHPHAPQGQQLGHAQAGVAQAEPVHSQEAQEDREEDYGREVVAIVPEVDGRGRRKRERERWGKEGGRGREREKERESLSIMSYVDIHGEYQLT